MRKFISAALAFAMTATAMAGMTVARAAYTGTGTEADPYIISDVGDWKTGLNGAGYYKLGLDIENTSSSINLNSAIVLDLNGHSITASVTKPITIGSNVTIKNTAETEAKVKTTNGYAIQVNSGDITIDNVTIESGNSAALLVGSSGAAVNLNITDSKLVTDGGNNVSALNIGKDASETVLTNTIVQSTGGGTAALSVTAGTLTINSGTFSRPGINKANIINVGGTADVTIKGGTIEASMGEGAAINIAKNFKGSLKIEGGTFRNTAASKNYVIQDATESSAGENASFTISGGTFDGIINNVKGTGNVPITITGGTYSFDPSAYVDEENYDVTEGTGTWTVTEKAAPPAPSAAYFTVDGTVEKAGTYTTVNVTANIDGVSKTAHKALDTTLTLEDSDDVSIGIMVNDIPVGTEFTITGITLE